VVRREVEKMVLKNVVEVNEEKSLFQLFFLKEDEDSSVEVEEVEKIDFGEVERRLKQGESVFITHKSKQKSNTRMVAEEESEELWYFSRV